MDDLLQEFLTECSESIATLDVELVRLEQTPDDPELLGNIFRLVHTIKGTCGFLGLPRLEAVAHAGENVLGKIRDGELTVTPEAVSLILESIDRIKDILAQLEANEAEPEGDDKELIKQLTALFEGGGAPEAAIETAQVGATTEAESEPETEAEAEIETEAAPSEGQNVDLAPEAQPEAVKDEVQESAVQEPAQSEPIAEQPNTEQPKAENAKAAENSGGGDTSIAAQSIRVGVEQLESLMTTVSELVLTRNQLLQMVRGDEDSEFKAPLQRLSHITSDLQEGVMKTRMQPIGNAWAKLPRIVRTLAHDLNKKINLDMVGADTELDRQVLELIKDPLTHMVRNSGDHGLETPEERRAAGKPEVGTVRLNAYHEGGHIIIEISDDGRGINIEAVKRKAIENGLATESALDDMSDQQILQLIFMPGFSTAAAVTNVSGRGVGMDVVRTNIERIGGTVSLTTSQGKGSQFLIKIPLTLAIVSALIVESRGERFAIPQISVLELVRATSDSDHKIETINDTPVLRLRDRLLPLVSLAQLLNLRPGRGQSEMANANPVEASEISASSEIAEHNETTEGGEPAQQAQSAQSSASDGRDQVSSEAFIVVTQVGAYTFGIIVDRVFDTEEIVVKPVSPILRDISMFSGNTILGDGSVIMILDPNGIATATGQQHVGSDDLAAESEAERRAEADKVAFILFRAGAENPKAVPLSLVARLEEVEVGDVEETDGMPVVQYRGQLMPLVPVDPSQTIVESGRQAVLVFSDRNRSMGLLVDEIVDIVEDKLAYEVTSSRDGYLGSALVAGKATDIIDIGYFLSKSFGNWFQGENQTVDGETRRLLLVEDSPFFRNLLTPILVSAGYKVTAVADADAALKMREDGEGFDIIVSDIEMPGMSGFEFAQACRSDDRWQTTPIVALSSHTAKTDFDRGREVGFADYVAKFDRDALLAALEQTLSMSGEAA